MTAEGASRVRLLLAQSGTSPAELTMSVLEGKADLVGSRVDVAF